MLSGYSHADAQPYVPVKATLFIRPIDVEVVASDPGALLVNQTGILVNGCGGDRSSFDVQFTGAGAAQAFDLVFRDAEFGDALGAIPVTIAPPVSVNRYLLLPRVDYQSADGAHRLMARLALSKLDRPDFVWTPYEDFISSLNQDTVGLAFRAISTLRPNLVNEARFGWNSDDLGWDRPQPQIPTLASGDGT